jgi:PAS domain S-box-containing protein
LRQQISRHRKPGCQRMLESSANRWTDVHEYPTRDGGLVMVRTDVTELKRAEMALRESETLLKHAAQIADLGHWVWDTQANKCLHCSEGLARMYGMTPEAYIAHHGSQRSGNTALAGDKERYDEVIDRATRLRKGYDIEFRERLADGSIRHLRERGEPVLDAAGRLVRMAGILQDITKHKRAEQVLQRAHDELEARVDERTEALRTANLLYPQPGDYWEDHLVGVLEVVAVSHGMVIFFDQKKDVHAYHWEWDTSKPRALSLEEFATHLRYKHGDSEMRTKTWACVHPRKE